jgi:hypothetical protein
MNRAAKKLWFFQLLSTSASVRFRPHREQEGPVSRAFGVGAADLERACVLGNFAISGVHMGVHRTDALEQF